MSLVRASNFRHVFGEALKDDYWYENLRLKLPSGDSNYVVCNSKFFALPGSGGSAVVVLQHSQYGKLDSKLPSIAGHQGAVLDLAFNPFNDLMLATASMDATIKLWGLPEEGGLKEDMREALQTLKGHGKKVTKLKFHPTMSNVLASCSVDKTLILWDIESQNPKSTCTFHTKKVQDFSFNLDGGLMVSTCEDKKIRICDPRVDKEVSVNPGHSGGKPCRVVWLKKMDKIFTVGFSRQAERIMKLWDPKKMDAPLVEQVIDNTSGVCMPFFDEDTSMMYVCGKGDTNIRYYEIDNEGDMIHKLSVYMDKRSTPQRGMGFMPKIALDIDNHEVARALKVTKDSVIPISFKVPRKTQAFEKELFPDTMNPKAAGTAADYFEGKNGSLEYVSMAPGERPTVEFTLKAFKPKSDAPKKKVVKETSQDNLKEENESLKKRVAELEEEVAELKQKLGEE